MPIGIPASLLPGLGYVAIQYAQLDNAINAQIFALSGMDKDAGIAVTSAVFNVGIRIEMLRRLIAVKVSGGSDQLKLNIIIARTLELIAIRNRIMHDKPYWTNPGKSEAGFFRQENLTIPQIKVQPPITINPTYLDQMGEEFMLLYIWLGMFRDKHPHWSDDARFPWRDRFPPKPQPPADRCPTCGRPLRASRRKASRKSPRSQPRG